jgi:hypothetical protein
LCHRRRRWADNSFDKLAPVPICSRAAIHFSVTVVSARNFIASFTFARSPFWHVASSLSVQPSSFNPSCADR